MFVGWMENEICCCIGNMFLKLLIDHYAFYLFYFKNYNRLKNIWFVFWLFKETKLITKKEKQQGNKSWLLALENLLVSCLLTAGY